MHGGGQQGGIRPGTVPTALCVGMGQAAKLISDEQAQESRKDQVKKLRDYFLTELLKLDPSVRLNGPELSQRHPGNANVLFPGFNGRGYNSHAPTEYCRLNWISLHLWHS